MQPGSPSAPLTAFLELLSRQGGVGTTAQAYALGLTGARVRTCIQNGVLQRIAYGVVEATGTPASTEKRLWTGVMLGATRSQDLGPSSGLCGPTAAWLHDLIDEEPEEVHVISTRRISNGVAGYVFHRTSRLPEAEMIRLKGFPATDAARTYIDLAGAQPWRSVSLLRRGLRKAAFTRDEIETRIHREARQGRTGICAAREALAKTDPDAARAKSWLEDHFCDLLIAAGYPRPIRNAKIRGSYGHDWEIDLYYPERRKGFEVSPSHTHSDVIVLNRDRRKENDLRLLGVEIVTVTETTSEAEFHRIARGFLGAPPTPQALF